jgi:mannose-6-phosphate isomerase-like protein (cupin superfamily)
LRKTTVCNQIPTTPDPLSPNWLNTLTGSRIRVQTSGAETNGRLCVIEYVEPPNTTPPVYTRHEFIEVFCVVKGVLTFKFEDEPHLQLRAGQSVTCPGWRPHSFWNETDEAVQTILVCTPAGLDDFFIKSDELLRQVQQSNRNTSQTNEQALAQSMKALRTHYGLEHVGRPPLPGNARRQ